MTGDLHADHYQLLIFCTGISVTSRKQANQILQGQRFHITRDFIYTRSVRKVSGLSFAENLVDFNEAPLHEATLNLNTHA